ncbi:MAG: hypothetical protein WDM85_08025 [Caulobacteraceae bacterium]
MPTRFIKLAGEIILAVPATSSPPGGGAGPTAGQVARLGADPDRRPGYKRNVADMRESPTFRLLELLEDRGASVSFHGSHVPAIPPTREMPSLPAGPRRRSRPRRWRRTTRCRSPPTTMRSTTP